MLEGLGLTFKPSKELGGQVNIGGVSVISKQQVADLRILAYYNATLTRIVQASFSERSLVLLCKFMNQSLLKMHFRNAEMQRQQRKNSISRNITEDNSVTMVTKPKPMERESTLRRVSRIGQQNAEKKVNECRDVSIVFVKLLSNEGVKPRSAQLILASFLECIGEESAVAREENCPLCFEHDGKFSLFISSQYKVQARIAVTSGQILFSEIGNELRRDASLLGEIVNVAARMLSLRGAENKVACDAATVSSSGDVKFHHFGEFLFKGKSVKTDIWILADAAACESDMQGSSSRLDRHLSFEMIGFTKEQVALREAIHEYLDKPSHNAILIQGPSPATTLAWIQRMFISFLAFQEILRLASVFSQYFYLEDVMAINCSDSTATEMIMFIEKLDVYSYLTVTRQIQSDEEQRSSTADLRDDQDAQQHSQTWCSFRHISITNTIYDSMSFSRRVELHGEIAEMFENIADPQNRRQELLPMIGFHYARSNRVERKINVLEEISLMYLETGNSFACCNSLRSLILFVDENRDMLISEFGKVKTDQILVGKRRAYWLSLIADSHARRFALKDARMAAFEAFKILGISDVENAKILKKEMKRSLVRQLVLMMKTKRGMKPSRKERRDRYGQIVLDPDIPTLDESIRFHACLSACGMGTCMQPNGIRLVPYSKGLSNVYMKPPNNIFDKIGEQADSFRHVHGVIKHMDGNLDEAIHSCELYRNFWALCGDEVQAFAGICFTCEASFLKGDLSYGFNNLLPFIERAPIINPFFSCESPHSLAVYFTYKGEWSEAKKHAELEYAKFGASSVKQVPNGIKAILLVMQPESTEAYLSILEPAAVAFESFDKTVTGTMGGIVEATFACCL
ncbi:hypothetical protein HDU97_008106 [Phlyctochytrium planicorne]|nr:hypothetical protein HDU97_008106 [Phlyctochytrium planicorne]